MTSMQEKEAAAKATMNSTYDAGKLNGTYVKEEEPISSYDMTPAPEERSPLKLKNAENYDIANLASDDDTDDEEHPKKEVPAWAKGQLFRQKTMEQIYNPPDVDKIFAMQDMPNLSDMFSIIKNRFHKRTSSAVWAHAPHSHKY